MVPQSLAQRRRAMAIWVGFVHFQNFSFYYVPCYESSCSCKAWREVGEKGMGLLLSCDTKHRVSLCIPYSARGSIVSHFIERMVLLNMPEGDACPDFSCLIPNLSREVIVVAKSNTPEWAFPPWDKNRAVFTRW